MYNNYGSIEKRESNKYHLLRRTENTHIARLQKRVEQQADISSDSHLFVQTKNALPMHHD
jgi:hypothetical protein